MHVFDLERRKLAKSFTTKAASSLRAALSGDGKTLVCGDDRLGVYDLVSGKELAVIPSPQAVLRVAISKDGKRVAGSHRGGKVTVWDVATRKALHTFGEEGGLGVAELAFSPDGKRLAAVGVAWSDLQRKAWLFDLDRLRVDASLGFADHQITPFAPCFVAFTSKGDQVMMAGRGRGLGAYIQTPETNKLRGEAGRPKGGDLSVIVREMNSAAMSPDARTLVAGYTRVKVYDLTHPNPEPEPKKR